MVVRDNFLRHIEKWNKSGDARTFGTLEGVSELNRGDIVMARYTVNTQSRTVTGSVPQSVSVWDPAAGGMVTRSTQRTYSYGVVPVYAYILIRKPGGDFEIISPYASTTAVGEYKNSGMQLWDDLKEILKKK
jgi:hypothetical protein